MKAIDLTGKVFGKLTVLNKTELKEGGSIVWHCKCSCGKEVNVSSRKLTSGNTKSCGCIRKSNKGISPVDLTGQRFGRLVVVSMTSKRISNSVVWKCLCDCGNTCFVSEMNLINGNTKSCGCLRKENVQLNSIRVIQHSLSNKRVNNKSGKTGVCFDSSTGKWMATIGFNGKDYYICRSTDKNKAIEMRKLAEQNVLKPFLDRFINEEYPDNCDELLKKEIQKLKEQIKNNNYQ